MAGTALRRRLSWQLAEVVDLVDEPAKVRSIGLICPGWEGHLPGQHIDVRLTAEDGYQAQRSYSIATPAEGERITITVELIEDGEVSPYLVEELVVGDQLELRGPIGGYFVWEPDHGGPLLLVAGGSGLVPLMAMVRLRARSESEVPVRLLLSSRSWEKVLYRSELETVGSMPGVKVIHTLTRSQPPGWTGHRGRIDRQLLSEVAWPTSDHPLCFVCGPTGLVEAAATALTDLGHDPGRIKTERFGPSGGTP
jgi:ferredoxin-NADP reductase